MPLLYNLSVKLINSIYFRIAFGYVVLIFPFALIFSYFYYITYTSLSPLKALSEIQAHPHREIFDRYLVYLNDENLVLYSIATRNPNLVKGFLSSQIPASSEEHQPESSCSCHSETSKFKIFNKTPAPGAPPISATYTAEENMLRDELQCYLSKKPEQCLEMSKKRIGLCAAPTS